MRHPAVAVLGQQGAGGGAFDPESDISWHSLFWAEGTNFAAQGYTDTDAVTTWPNETGESDAAQATSANQPSYEAARTALGSRPSVVFSNGTDPDFMPCSFGAAPSTPVSVVSICDLEAFSGIDPRTFNSSALWFVSSSTGYRLFAGSFMSGDVDSTLGAHLMVSRFDGSTGNDVLYQDGTEILSANAGSNSITTAFTIGGVSAGVNRSWNGGISLLGIYEGDITADGNWSAFESWVASHYGITIS